MKRSFLSLLFFAGLLVLWDVLVRLLLWSPVLLPSPWKVVEYLQSLRGRRHALAGHPHHKQTPVGRLHHRLIAVRRPSGTPPIKPMT